MKLSINPLLVTGCAVILAVGCVGVTGTSLVMAQSTANKDPLMAQSSAIAGKWRLVSMGATAAPSTPLQTTELSANFEGDRISGSGGCNRFTGSYQAESSTLSIGALASTRMACEESVMNQETNYLTALQGAQRYEINEQGELQIFYQTTQESGILRFTSQTVRALW